MTILWGGMKNIGSSAKKHEKIEKVTSSQDDDSVEVLTKNILNKLAPMGHGARARPSVISPVETVGNYPMTSILGSSRTARGC